MQIHIYIYTQYHNDTINKQTQEDFFNKYVPHTLFVTFEKVIQGLRVREELETEQNWNILTPLLWPSALCLSRSPDAQPEAQGLTLLAFSTTSYSATFLDPNSSGAPKDPSGLMWLSLPQLVYNSVSNSNCNCLTSVLTELYNSSTPTHSPTRFLESHVGSSSSGNNCHAFHRSLSSGASVYECTIGIFYIVPFHLPISADAISSHNCH